MSFRRESKTTHELFTFQDAFERLGVAAGVRSTGQEQNALRMAIMDAYRELPAKHDWSYYKRVLQVTTVPPESGKVADYDHTGGTHERQLTLTTGTWNSVADAGQVIMNHNLYDIDKRISDTVVTLSVDSNPGRDLSEEGITWCQTAYPLGQRVRRVHYVAESNNDVPITYVPHDELAKHLRRTPAVSTPIMFNIHQTGGLLSEVEIEFAPPPLDARAYLIPIEAQPRPIRTVEDAVVGTASGTTFTLSSGSAKSYHKGAVLRVYGDTTQTPTGWGGDGSDYYPFVEQRIITAVNSTTEVEIESAFASEPGSVNAVITDPLDIDPVVMWDYFFALCRRKLSQYSPVGTKTDEQMALEKMALRTAIANDPYVGFDMLTRSPLSWVQDMDFILEFPITG